MKYYLAIFLRRLPIFMLVATLFSVIAFGLAMSLPPTYSAQARFLMESSQIPNALAPPTVSTPAREQLQLFEQRLMGRGNLLDIARKINVFKDQNRMSPDEIVEAMQASTRISTNVTRGGAAIMTVRFSANTGQKAAGVMNEYTAIIQRLDVEQRTGRAGQTLEFFQQEVDRLGAELATLSARVVDFKTANSGALPEGQSYRLGQQGILQERIAQSDREVSTLTNQRARLIEIFNATGRIEGLEGIKLSPEQTQLDGLRRQLSEALLVYAPGNPRIKMLEGRIRQLEEMVAQQSSAAPAGASPLDLQLAEIDARVAAVQEQKANTEATLATLNQAIEQTAANAVQLSSLERDYANIQSQYNNAVNNLAQASTGERIEILARGARVSVLEQPTAPSRPSSPNRILLAGGGTLAGILAGLALIVLIEMLNTAPRRPEAIVRKLGITPLATLPYIQDHRTMVRQRRLRVAVILAILISVPLAVWAVHTFYQPLDLLAERVANKFGFRW
ncbi:MAG: GumC family protein [Paracoccaceae bacterium]